MRAVVYSGYGMMPELTQVPDPSCPPDGVVITVGASGVCRSDWHAWKGHDPVALPHIGGRFGSWPAPARPARPGRAMDGPLLADAVGMTVIRFS